jgi:outer membrane protein OmpA-like peptidoglycan-associated protein/tetratricopeptide (TPR) repeat protein
MKKHIKTILIIILLLCNGSLLFSQETRTELGDKYFDEFAYKKAITLYEGIPDSKKSWHVFANLGDSYYNTSQPEKAVLFYKEALKRKRFNMERYRLKMALSMLSTDDCVDVINELVNNDMMTLQVLGHYFGLDLETGKIPDDMALQICQNNNNPTTDVKLKNLDINSNYSDFGGFLYNDPNSNKEMLYFASARKKTDNRKHNKRLYKWNEYPFLDFYEAIVTTDSFKIIAEDSSKISTKINNAAHQASIAITKDGKYMYFSGGEVRANNKLKYNKQGISVLKLQRASLDENNKWTITDEDKKVMAYFDFENYSIGSPALSPDNKRLYFVSCAPFPEAQGQTDIYYTDIGENGTFGPIVNLGEEINSPGREMFPFVSEDNVLYFSSDGVYDGEYRQGLLDIYYYDLSKKDKVKSLGEPFNSRKDDFAFFMRSTPEDSTYSSQGYFSSNRDTFVHLGDTIHVKGDDDIYSFNIKKACSQTIQGSIADLKTGSYIDDAIVELIDSDGVILDTLQVNSTGHFKTKVSCQAVFSLRGSKARYNDDLQKIETNSTSILNNIQLKLEPYPCEIKVEPIIFKFNDFIIQPKEGVKLKPLINLLIANRDLRIRIESHTDSVGSITDNLKLSQKRANATRAYLISKEVHENQILSAIGLGENCPLYSTDYIHSLSTRKEREEAHNKNRRSIFILEDCEDYASDCNKNIP